MTDTGSKSFECALVSTLETYDDPENGNYDFYIHYINYYYYTYIGIMTIIGIMCVIAIMLIIACFVL
jgi:hypothetical protein